MKKSLIQEVGATEEGSYSTRFMQVQMPEQVVTDKNFHNMALSLFFQCINLKQLNDILHQCQDFFSNKLEKYISSKHTTG